MQPAQPAESFVADSALEQRFDGRAWSAGWALGLAGALAALLIAMGGEAVSVATAFALGAAPGVAGAYLDPKKPFPFGLLAAWAVASGLAVAWAGGVAGPLAPLLAAPLAAAIAFGAPPTFGLWAALGAFALALLSLPIGFAPAAPTGTLSTLSASAALLAALGGLAGAAVVRARLQKARLEAAVEDRAFFLDIADALPVTTLALDRTGSVEARLGPPAPGLVANLRGGLVAAAVEADRPALGAALATALDQGAAEAAFSPAYAPGRRLALSLRRRNTGGLAAVLREVDPLGDASAVQAPQVATLATDSRIAELEAALARAEAARAEAESTAQARARFLANMSHELRTPLNAILGFSDIMKTRLFGPIPDRYGEYAELIHDSGRHLTDLINDVLDMSKIEADRYELRVETFDVREAVTAALRILRLQADEAGIHLRSDSPREPVIVNADRRAVKQMVLNLVSNALKFTPKGGRVSVATQAAPDGRLEITVVDNGVGIAPEDLERLGRPFEQAGDARSRARGTGLGLSLVKAFARLHGGELGLESSLGEGTAATLRLPVLAKRPVAADAPAPIRSAEAALDAPPPPVIQMPQSPAAGDGGPSTPRHGTESGAKVIPLNLVRPSPTPTI